jgi:hypothetical protein
MNPSDLDPNDSGRRWTRPTLRRLSAGGRAAVAPDFETFEGTAKTLGGKTYPIGPAPS